VEKPPRLDLRKDFGIFRDNACPHLVAKTNASIVRSGSKKSDDNLSVIVNMLSHRHLGIFQQLNGRLSYAIKQHPKDINREG
jgi:hypothetical protein